MKKVLIGLFLVTSLSVLGVNKGKVPMQRDIDYVRYHYELDSKYENLFSKEKKEFKDKWENNNNNKKNLIALLKKYIEKYPDDAYAYEVLGTAYMSDNFKEAETNFLKAIKLGDDDTAKYSLALLYADKGEKDNDKEKTKLAEKYFKELENEGINSHYNLENLRNVKNGALIGYAEPIFGLAAYYDNYENYKISEKLFLPLAQKGMMQAQYLLALGYYHAGNLKEAEKWAKKTLEKPERKQPDDIEAAKELLNRINSKLKELNKK